MAPVLFGNVCVVLVVALWFPLREGRDMMTYFLCFRDLLQVEPEFPLLESLQKSRLALLSERVSALGKRLHAGFRRFKFAR